VLIKHLDFDEVGTPQIFYENLDLSNYVYTKVLKPQKQKREEMRKYHWVPIKAGFIFYTSNQAYFLNVSVKYAKKDSKW